MTDRQSRHPDNDLIDAMSDAPGQKSSGGGNLARAVGKRAEARNALEGEVTERVTGSDDPKADERKGGKTLSKLQQRKS